MGKQPDTTRTFQILSLKFDPKSAVSPPTLFVDHINGEQLNAWAKQKINKSNKITLVQQQSGHDLLNESKISFSDEIAVEHDKLFFHPQAPAPPVFRVNTNPSPFICPEIHYKFDRYTEQTAGFFVLFES